MRAFLFGLCLFILLAFVGGWIGWIGPLELVLMFLFSVAAGLAVRRSQSKTRTR